MSFLLHKSKNAQLEPERVRLEISGPVLANALANLAKGAEELGGVERYAQAVQLKSDMFKDALCDGKANRLDLDTLMGLCVFMSTVRRRISPYLDENNLGKIRDAISNLLEGASETSTTDTRIRAFCATFPEDKKHRWVRDLAAEILHNVDPERYPLMSRWVWDAKANTGVIREIWHGDSVDHMTIPVPDTYETFVVLREELSQYLTSNGFFQNILQYTDLLTAQVYAEYICAQGGSYLRTDFSAPEDPMEHTRRILGLDGVKPNSARTRLRSIDGEAFVLEDVKLLG